MKNTKLVAKDTVWIGGSDRRLALFENLFPLPNGVSYNSYVVLDEKITLFDTADVSVADQYLENLHSVLGEKKPDYLVVLHMEPDHCSLLQTVLNQYPETTVVSSMQTFKFISQFFPELKIENQQIVKEGDTLCTGAHTFHFVAAPMVHWPEVIMTYDDFDKVLFSADAFGKFGALDTDEDWACEARRYYFGIVGKYGAQVQSVLKKAAALDIKIICPLHGPWLFENIPYYLNLYDIWSSYGVESDGVVIAYTSVYGHTEKAVNMLKAELENKGVKVPVFDLARCDMAEAVEDAFRYGKLVLATTTYNGDIFPFMKTFIEHLVERNFQNRTVGFIENGSWAPQASRIMRGMLEQQKNLTLLDADVKIYSAVSDKNVAEIQALASALLQ